MLNRRHFFGLSLFALTHRIVLGTDVSTPPELACQFETVFDSKVSNQPSFKSVWRLWRNAQEVESWQVGSKEGEVSSLDGAGGVQLYRIFHPERTEVYYSAMELKVLGKTLDWNQTFSLVSPIFLREKLARTGSEVLLETSLEKYEGAYEGRKWTVLWSPEDQLAYQLRVESDRGVSQTTLVERHLLASQPWQRLRNRGYNAIDFADLGDSETDPTIRRIMNRLGMSCSHRSCGGACVLSK